MADSGQDLAVTCCDAMQTRHFFELFAHWPCSCILLPTLKFTTSLWSVCELGIANSAARAAFSRCSCRSSSLKHVRLCQANATKLGIWELFTWEFGIIFSKSKSNGSAAKLGSCAARIRIRWSSKWPHQCSCEGFIFMWQSYGTLALCSRAK